MQVHVIAYAGEQRHVPHDSWSRLLLMYQPVSARRSVAGVAVVEVRQHHSMNWMPLMVYYQHRCRDHADHYQVVATGVEAV